MRIVKYVKPSKVRRGDEILSYGTVTFVNADGTFQTSVGYTMLLFPKGKTVPVIQSDLMVIQ